MKLDRKVKGVRSDSATAVRGAGGKGGLPVGRDRRGISGRSHGREEEFQTRSEAAYRFGFDDGKQIGLQEGREEVKQTVSCLKRMLAEMTQKKENLLREVDEAVVRLAVAVAETVLRREVETDPVWIKRLTKESLKLVEDRQRISIKVHPTDWEGMKVFEEEMLPSIHGVKHLEIKEDDHVEPGGCIIESDSGIVDAQLRTQLEEIAERLVEAV